MIDRGLPSESRVLTMMKRNPTTDATRHGSTQPSFLITIDTEGDNLWSLPETIETRNAMFLERFQSLCERFDLRPTYLTNWEMACSGEFREFGLDALRRDTAEIGMHLHAWNNPPLSAFELQNPRRQACLIESPESEMREKIARLTDLLEETFSTKMLSHRAGRWGMNSAYARLLAERGYLVDCSVTPGIHWQYEHVDGTKADCDYRGFPEHAYWLDLDNIRLAGASPLLEIPMTVLPCREPWWAKSLRRAARPSRIARRIMDRAMPQYSWFRPFRGNVTQLPKLLDRVEAEGRDYIEFMIHSSELMPGGSPSFPNAASIEHLYERLEALFAQAQGRFVGRTLSEYYRQFAGRRSAESNVAVRSAIASEG